MFLGELSAERDRLVVNLDELFSDLNHDDHVLFRRYVDNCAFNIRNERCLAVGLSVHSLTRTWDTSLCSTITF